jgi:hypothetical protein
MDEANADAEASLQQWLRMAAAAAGLQAPEEDPAGNVSVGSLANATAAAADAQLTSRVGQLLRQAASLLRVDRSAMPLANALYTDPEELLRSMAQVAS